MDLDLAMVGIAVSLVGMLGGIIVRDRQVMKMIHDGDEKNSNDLKCSENAIYNRINDIVRETNRNFREQSDSNHEHFVSKGHFDGYIDGLKSEMASMNHKLDMILDKHLK